MTSTIGEKNITKLQITNLQFCKIEQIWFIILYINYLSSYIYMKARICKFVICNFVIIDIMNTTRVITHTTSIPHLSNGLHPYPPTFIPISPHIYTHISQLLHPYLLNEKQRIVHQKQYANVSFWREKHVKHNKFIVKQ